MKRVALYVRVSTQEQKLHGLSIDTQLDALKKYSSEHGYAIVGVYNDAGISGRKKYTNRPALMQMIEDCKAGKVDLILFTKLDRWFRSVSDYYAVHGMLEDSHVPWRAIWEDYETETSSGIFKVNIMLSIAQAESDRTGERIRAGFEYKRSRGEYIGQPPFGYKVVDKHLVKNEEQEEAVKALFQTFFDTSNITYAMKAVQELGYPEKTREWASVTLKKPIYAGRSETGVECEPYITMEQHLSILEKLQYPTRRPKRDSVFLFAGIAFCGYCGRRLICRDIRTVNKNKTVRYHHQYDCSKYNNEHAPMFITGLKLERVMLEHLDEMFAQYMDEVRTNNRKVGKTSSAKEIKKLQDRIQRLKILFADGDLTIDEYRTQRDTALLRMQELEKSCELMPEPTPLPDDWRSMYDRLDDEHKRAFWARAVKRIEITKETKENPSVIFY